MRVYIRIAALQRLGDGHGPDNHGRMRIHDLRMPPYFRRPLNGKSAMLPWLRQPTAKTIARTGKTPTSALFMPANPLNRQACATAAGTVANTDVHNFTTTFFGE